MQTPTIAALKKADPNCHITVWVAPRGTKALAENDPNVDVVLEMPIKTSTWQHLRQIQKLRVYHFDAGIILSPGQLLKSAAYLYLAGIEKRVGHTYPLGSNNHSSFLLTNTINEDQSLHDIEQNLNLLKTINNNSPSLPITHYTLHIPSAAKTEATHIIQELNIQSNQLFIGLHAGSSPSFAWKRWPLDRFAELAAWLIQEHNAHILLFGGPDEQEQKTHLKELIEQSLPPTTYPLQPTIINSSLLTTAALMQQCRLVVSNDSGLMHLAAAVGTETIGLFGPTDEAKTGPHGLKSHVIRAPGTKPAYDTEKRPSLGTKPHPTILALTVAQIKEKIVSLL